MSSSSCAGAYGMKEMHGFSAMRTHQLINARPIFETNSLWQFIEPKASTLKI
jgi:hypothetical protein